ncbi:hypothetical protein BDV19DRAFT_356502 [Aspergillus venezuelensis]
MRRHQFGMLLAALVLFLSCPEKMSWLSSCMAAVYGLNKTLKLRTPRRSFNVRTPSMQSCSLEIRMTR